MKVLISGICGFVGSTLAHSLLDQDSGYEIMGFDNFVRPGSYLNREPLQARGVRVRHADTRLASDLEALPAFDWVIDAAAHASVLSGVDGATNSRQLVENNLYGTVNLLEAAKRFGAGFILLSTSRVYSIKPLATLPVQVQKGAYEPDESAALPPGLSREGITEEFPVVPPVSLYGSTKLASEFLALEYGEAFGFPVWINRCGVLAGAGQFGRADQGIFAYWINAWRRSEPLQYIGFDGTGLQTRDCLHPRDLAPLLRQQMAGGSPEKPRVLNLGGGREYAMSLVQLSDWCAARFGQRDVARDPRPRLFDLPWVVMDSQRAATNWDWRPATHLNAILEEIAQHAEANPDWLRISSPP